MDGTVVETLVTTRPWLELDRQFPDEELSGPERVCFVAWWMLREVQEPPATKCNDHLEFAEEWAITVAETPGPK